MKSTQTPNPGIGFTEDEIIKFNFANHMLLNMATFPDGYDNKALINMAHADAELANARKWVKESLELIEEAERMTHALVLSTKEDKIASSNLTTHINLLKQFHETAKQAEKTIQAFIDEKIPQFQKALQDISKAPKNTNMTPVTLERQKAAFKSIHDQFTSIEKLKVKVKESWSVVNDYNQEFEVLPAQSKLRRGETSAPKPTSTGG